MRATSGRIPYHPHLCEPQARVYSLVFARGASAAASQSAPAHSPPATLPSCRPPQHPHSAPPSPCHEA
ncbi:hypothetical protein PsYK624_163970 [Phanerochaete sordida]|uniref:Uncharacterized protein n=1 Tax=Phanerochaete sordida TaxID=48140 RepID=A0A9P3GRD7_9APHY|nr:hypothetical protein PsYK624_163970 [Phanerochaete sordida]